MSTGFELKISYDKDNNSTTWEASGKERVNDIEKYTLDIVQKVLQVNNSVPHTTDPYVDYMVELQTPRNILARLFKTFFN